MSWRDDLAQMVDTLGGSKLAYANWRANIAAMVVLIQKLIDDMSAGGIPYSGAIQDVDLNGKKLLNLGDVGVGLVNPTAALHLKAGDTTPGTAPFKLTSQMAPLAAIEPGVFEYVGHSLQFSQHLYRRGVSMTEGVILTTTTLGNTIDESGALLTAHHGIDYLEVGKTEEMVLIGILEQRADAGAQLDFNVNYGGIKIFTISTTTNTAILPGSPFRLTVTQTCRSIGATGEMQINATLIVAGNQLLGEEDLITIDTTSAQDTTITAQWSEAEPDDLLTVQQGWVHCIDTNK